MIAANYLVQAIEKLKVPYVFGLPGSTEAPFLDALAADNSFEYILTLHENISVAMADGFARASGKVGIANLHTSVGTANGISQLYNAFRDRSPLVLLSCHKSTDINNRNGFCVVDHLPNMTREFTKWSGELTNPEQIVDDFYRAVKISLSSPVGPTFLSLPENILGLEVERPLTIDVEKKVVPTFASALPEEIQRCADLLNRHGRVVIIAGDNVAEPGTIEFLEKAADKLNAIVLREPRRSLTRFTYSTENTNYAGEYDVNHPAVKEADCIFALGSRLFVEFSYPKMPEIRTNIPVIHLHESPDEIARLYPVTLGMVGSSKAMLKQLLPLLENKSVEWAAKHREVYEQKFNAAGAQVYQEGAYLDVEQVVQSLSKLLPDDVVIVDEGIRSSRALLNNFPYRYPNSYFSTRGGALGWGLPAAIGVHLANPQRRVVAFVGDGSALFTIQALWTAAKYKMPIIFMIVNNRGYLAVKAAIKEFRRSKQIETDSNVYPASSFGESPIDFVQISRGFGVDGVSVNKIDEMESAIKMALNKEEPMLIDIQVEEVKV